MATNAMLWLPVLIVLLGGGVGGGEFDLTGRATENPLQPLRGIYAAEIGVREATGRNDGPRVAEYLAYCGLAEGYEWCAAFVSWCHGQAGHAEPRNAWAAALFPVNRTIWHQGDRQRVADGGASPAQGDVFGIYVAAKKRIGHCGFVDAWDGTWCITVEGNVDNAVVRKRRSIRSIRAVARWADQRPITPY